MLSDPDEGQFAASAHVDYVLTRRPQQFGGSACRQDIRRRKHAHIERVAVTAKNATK
jgi:hypothetical protein